MEESVRPDARRARHLSSGRDPEAGNSLVLAMIIMTALGTLSVFTVYSVRGGLQTSANDRFHTIATYAAESGGAAAMQYLRTVYNRTSGWTAIPFSPNNATPHVPDSTELYGNEVASGSPGNPFSDDMRAMYKVEILNNRDSGYATGNDTDRRVVIRSTGYGPNSTVAIIEWEMTTVTTNIATPCSAYAQRSQSDSNAGTNDCLGTIDSGTTESFTP